MIDAKKLIQEVLELAAAKVAEINGECTLTRRIRAIANDEQAIAALLAKCEAVPVVVFDHGPWIYEPEGSRHTGAELDAAAFSAYRAAPVLPGGSDNPVRKMTDDEIRLEWKHCGGYIHHRLIETVSMPEAEYFGFRRSLGGGSPVLPAYDEVAERAEFYRVMRQSYGEEHFGLHETTFDGLCYNSQTMNGAWDGWQAGRAALREGK